MINSNKSLGKIIGTLEPTMDNILKCVEFKLQKLNKINNPEKNMSKNIKNKKEDQKENVNHSSPTLNKFKALTKETFNTDESEIIDEDNVKYEDIKNEIKKLFNES